MLEISDRYSQFQKGAKRYFTGKPCKRGHVCKRFVATGGCVDCTNWVKRKLIAPNVFHPLQPLVFTTGETFKAALMPRAYEILQGWANAAMREAFDEHALKVSSGNADPLP